MEKFFAPACVIDVSREAAANPDFLLTAAACGGVGSSSTAAWRAGSWVLMRTDWSKRRDAAAFLNMKEDGSHVPGPHPDLVPFLARERDVIGWGSEGVGTDAGQAFRFDPPFPCHSIMHGSNKFGLASLTNLDQLPPKGAILVTPPLKIVRRLRESLPRAGAGAADKAGGSHRPCGQAGSLRRVATRLERRLPAGAQLGKLPHNRVIK